MAFGGERGDEVPARVTTIAMASAFLYPERDGFRAAVARTSRCADDIL
jgi:hypothetical protein